MKLAARPGPFLDAYELRDTDRDDGRFLRFILEAAAERESVRDAFDQRVVRWLGSWTRALPEGSDGPEREHRHAERDSQIDAKLAALTPDERRWFDENCPEIPRPSGLAMAATLHLAGRARTPFAAGLVTFAFAYKVAGAYNSPFEELAWVLRLDRADPAGFARAVRGEIARFTTAQSSTLARQAAAFALRLMGTQEDEDAAEALQPRQSPTIFGEPDVDPLDPAAFRPAGLEGAATRVSSMDPMAIWNHMSTTAEDHDLERTLELLVRFEPDSIREFLDRVAGTVAARSGLPLRQLSWRLPWLSPILDEGTVAAITRRVSAAISVAIARGARADLVEHIPVEHLDWVAARLPAALERLADTVDATVTMLVE